MGATRSGDALAILDRQQRERVSGKTAVTVIPHDAHTALAIFEPWATALGAPVIVAPARHAVDAIARAMVDAIPLARLVQAARRRVAPAIGRRPDEIDGSLAARSPSERRRWIEDHASGDRGALAAGMALCAVVENRAPTPPDEEHTLAWAAALLGTAGPVAALVIASPAEPASAAIVAGTLAAALATQPVALAIPEPALAGLVDRVDGAVWSLLRQGVVAAAPPRPVRGGRSDPERILATALERDRRTRGRFELCGTLDIRFGGRPCEIDLLDRELAIAVEVDGYHHFTDPERYRIDRRKDVLLQRAGFWVSRVLDGDVRDRVELVVEQIADLVAFRRNTCTP